ncbi:concanavalin A-like lectin/glucanase domain-containing protein [Sphaerosporella brunnea]|uniref:Protein SSH4 n=1 Tax=Sphaerosporella brunnea TaxID=1250544 RepID=A0A5J5EUK7_9PEZI|nr:concanavalin A-like lectin/glucanase domain-containing protein [Sphaerosporella brunnea]
MGVTRLKRRGTEDGTSFPASSQQQQQQQQQHVIHPRPAVQNVAILPPPLDDGATGSAGRGVLIGLLSAFGSAALVALIFGFIYFLRYTARGRILLDVLGRPGQYDDEAATAREEAEALENMDEIQRLEYWRAKAFVEANPPDSVPTDISLSQFLAIQEKGVSAWEFEAELEIANCFVEARTEVEFFDSVCSVQSNLPVPKQNEVYYWEAKLYDKPESTLVSIGMTTKPYPMFRLPGWHKHSLAYTSTGHRRHNQPFSGTLYGPPYHQGDVIGVGYRPRSGTVFFTRNGKKLDDVAHGLKSFNLFPTLGANGPCTIHVNFGQLGFVYIEANVKKWGLAPMNGSLAPPPPYGSEQGSILLETGQRAPPLGRGEEYFDHGRGREHRGQQPTSPGPAREPGEIGLTDITHSNNTNSEVVIRVHEPPPDYASQTSSSGDEDESEGRRARRAQEVLGNAPAYKDIVRERSPANGGRWRSGSAPAGPSLSRD